MTDKKKPLDLTAAMTADCAKYGHVVTWDERGCSCGKYTMSQQEIDALLKTGLYD